jgi:hypothetical protein
MSKSNKITKEQIYNARRKESRDEELEQQDGWTSKNKVHKSIKSYNRKDKHKATY